MCIVQFPVTNGHGIVGPVGKVPTPTTLRGANSKQPPRKSSLNSGGSFKPPATTFVTKSSQATSTNTNTIAPSKTQVPISKTIVKNDTSTGSATKSSQVGVRTRQRSRARVTVRRSRRRYRDDKKVIINNNGTARNGSNFQANNATTNVTAGHRIKAHPCNSVQAQAMNYKVDDMECRRWRNSELQQQMDCMGKFNHEYLATSVDEAMKFRDLDTGQNVNLRKSFILNPRQSDDHRKRNIHIDPGETLIVQCHGGKTPTESGHLRICPVCMAITRQPSTPRRFPEYINELLCDPQLVSSYLPGIDAFCVQKTFTLDLLQFDGDWELNPTLSAEAGNDVYTEKWESYTQLIRRHCACELLPSSLIATYL